MSNSKYIFYILIALSFALMACGGDSDDSSCTQEDWVGTYEVVSEMCTDSTLTISIDTPFEIIASGNDLSIDGFSFEFNGCTAEPPLGEFTLNGNEITHTASGFGADCTNVFRKI